MNIAIATEEADRVDQFCEGLVNGGGKYIYVAKQDIKGYTQLEVKQIDAATIKQIAKLNRLSVFKIDEGGSIVGLV